MSWFTNALTSSVGRKVLMSLTGLFLITFLIVHLSGNFALLSSDPTAFNLYSDFMSHHPIVRVPEIILLVGFVLHIYQALALNARNAKAKGTYAYKNTSGLDSYFSKYMVQSGMIVLVFLALHLYQFYVQYHFFGDDWIATDANGEPIMSSIVEGAKLQDMYALVYSTLDLSTPVGVASTLFYVLAFTLLAFHLNHGFQSAFQSLGLRHVKYTPLIKGVGALVSWAIPAAFAAIALYVGVQGLMA